MYIWALLFYPLFIYGRVGLLARGRGKVEVVLVDPDDDNVRRWSKDVPTKKSKN